MKKNSPLILYIVIILIILGGLALFIFKDVILGVLRQQTGVDVAARVSGISATVPTVASSSLLDTSVLKLPRFTSLVNNVINFNFDNICWRPDSVTIQPVISDVTGGASSTATVNCVQGNGSPFGAPKK